MMTGEQDSMDASDFMQALSLGVSDFKCVITEDRCYVDKTLFIRDFLINHSTANFFLRPRRFGKTLLQSTLKYFFEDTHNEEKNAENRKLFTGTKIMDAGNKFTSWMTSRPVIALSLKSVNGDTFGQAYSRLEDSLSVEFIRHKPYLLTKLTEESALGRLNRICDMKAADTDITGSLLSLTRWLTEVSGKRPVLLIDN